MQSAYVPRSQKHKKTDCLTVMFALLGSAHVKALSKMLMKLKPNFIFFQSALYSTYYALNFGDKKVTVLKLWPGADAIKKFTPSLGISYLGV